MIRKPLIFVLLVGAGLFVLHLALGGEQLASFRTAEQQERSSDRPAHGLVLPGHDKDGERMGSVTITASGRMEIPRWRLVSLPNGETRQLQLYVLKAEDSEPLERGLFRLERATVDFFEIRGSAEDPRAVPSGRMNAQQMFVQLGRDAHGQYSVVEEKDMDLRDVVLRTTKDSKVKNLEMTVGRLLARVAGDNLQLHTPDADEAFDLRIAGDNPLHMSGHGLEAVLPTDQRPRDKPVPIDIRVQKEPRLVQGRPERSLDMRAAGTLHYVERVEDGAATVSMQDQVEVHGLLDKESARPSIARGQSLEAALLRSKKGADPDASWRRVALVGAPAFVDTKFGRVSCTRLDVLPGAREEPWLVSARGGSPSLETIEGEGANAKTTTSWADRIHLVRLRAHLGRWLEPLGIPGWMLSRELIVFEGAARTECAADKLLVTASRGLQVQKAMSFTAMRGLGDVHVQRGDDDLRGNMGFLLRQGEEIDLRLGPPKADAQHRYTLVRSDGTKLHGSGSFRMQQRADQRGSLELSSPMADIAADLARGELHDLASLHATFGPQGLDTLTATGHPAIIVSRAEDGTESHGAAESITSTAPDRYLLRGAPASLSRGAQGDFRGREIVIERLQGSFTILQATGDAVVEGSQITADQTAGTAEPARLGADRIRYLPFLVPPTALGWYARALPAALRDLPGTAMRAPHLLAHGSVGLEQFKNGKLSSRATGTDLVFRLEPESGRLVGNPARLQQWDDQGRENTGEAPVVLMWKEGETQFMTLLPENGVTRFSIASTGSEIAGARPGSRRVILCRAPVRVRGTQIVFAGPVVLHTLNDDGSEDPDGLHLEAGGMTLDRDAHTGEIVNLVATGGASLRMQGCTALAHELALDLERQLCIARDRNGAAQVRLPNGMTERAAYVEFNYETYACSVWNGRSSGPLSSR